jgi:hypothetical protein
VRRALKSTTAKFLVVLAGAALSAAVSAGAQTAEPSIEDLQKQLRQRDALIQSRDALIQSLVRRVEKLERQMGAVTAAPGGPPATTMRAVARSRPGTPPATATEVALHPDQAAPTPMTAQAAPAAEPTPPPGPTQPSTAKPPAPGQFEVSEEAAERALERTLVATGNLVLPEGFAEIQPIFSYQRGEVPALVLFNVHQNVLTPALGFRVGLPWESQVDMAVPWNFVEQKQIDITVQPSTLLASRWGNAIGDLTVGATKTLLHESGWVPGLLGRVSYEIPTGPLTAHGTPLPSGRNQLSFSLTGLKRQDPLVFVATGGYTKAFQSNQFKLGDSTNFTLGAFLATSPETTLRGVLSQTFSQDLTVRGVTFPGSSSVQSFLTFGASSILGRGILVDLQTGIGLTNSTPKYQVVLSGTYRFPVTGP